MAERFVIAIPDQSLADLRARLSSPRWPRSSPGEAWAYGADLDYLRDLVDYWRDDFDWKGVEDHLNSFEHYRQILDGYGVHFVHRRAVGGSGFPLVLTHGWPGLFLEMLPVADLLSNPAAYGGEPDDAFDVVIPSLPGFAFSDDTTSAGYDAAATADLWDGLMQSLSYERYGAYGSDWGSLVTRHLGARHGAHVAGIITPGTPPATREPETPEERAAVARRSTWQVEETGYQRIHGTKPQTLNFALADSPVGLAAWIVEKLRAWSDCGGDIETRFSKDQILTWISLFWFTECIGSSMRFYHANGLGNSRGITPINVPSDMPQGYITFPGIPGLGNPPLAMIEQPPHIDYWSHRDSGGHFPGIEEPEFLAEDLRAFFRPFR